MSDDDLTAWITASRASLDVELAHARRHVAPDFAAVVAEAHARNPSVIDAAAVSEAAQFAPIVALDRGPHELQTELTDAELDLWIAVARHRAESAVVARRLVGVPALPTANKSTSPARGGRRLAGAFAIAAVLVGLALAVPRLLEAFVDGNYQEAQGGPNQAEFVAAEPSPEHGQLRLGPKQSPLEPVLQRAIPAVAEPIDANAHKPVRRPQRRASKPDNQHDRDRIAELDAEAQARWAAGDLDGAERRFRSIIEIADHDHRRFADLAYGDLFTLARRSHDDAAVVELWHEYLERFPRGRFADDARAGLCLRSSEVEQPECWTAYLDEFPQGVHAKTAERALGIDEPGAGTP